MSNLIKAGLVTVNKQQKRMIDSDKRNDFFQPLILSQLEQIHAGEDPEFINKIKMQNLEVEEEEELQDLEQKQEKAKEEAKKIVSNAKEEAKTIVKNAKEEAGNIKLKAKEEGEEQGYKEGIQKAQIEINQQKIQLEERAQCLEEEYRQEIEKLEPKFVELVIRLVEKLTNIVTENKKEVLFYLIHNALLGIEQSKNFVIHVSKEDYHFVFSKREEIIKKLQKEIELDIIEDKTLKEKQCIIETPSKVIDCSLDIQLEQLLEDLKLLSEFGK